MVWLVITYIIIGLVALILFFSMIGWFVDLSRKSRGKKWEVGDLVKMSFLSSLKKPDEHHKLLGWNSEHIFVEEDKIVHKCEWKHLEYNKSASWRENYEKCEKFMGTKPEFNSHVQNDVKEKEEQVYDKPIDLMSEVECQVYLKRAIEEENFEAAELIRKRLENFR